MQVRVRLQFLKKSGKPPVYPEPSNRARPALGHLDLSPLATLVGTATTLGHMVAIGSHALHIGGVFNSICRHLPLLLTAHFALSRTITLAFHVVPKRCQLAARRSPDGIVLDIVDVEVVDGCWTLDREG